MKERGAGGSRVSGRAGAEGGGRRGVREGVGSGFGGDGNSGTDELFNEAVALVITHQQGSISLLQRRLKVGYSRAARLIDEMEQTGVVGSFTGSKAREVLVDETYLEMIRD